MLEVIKDEFDESPEDILKTVQKMLNKKEEENKEKTRK